MDFKLIIFGYRISDIRIIRIFWKPLYEYESEKAYIRYFGYPIFRIIRIRLFGFSDRNFGFVYFCPALVLMALKHAKKNKYIDVFEFIDLDLNLNGH